MKETKETAAYDLTTGAGLLACPRCDALYVDRHIHSGIRASCARCGTVLANPRRGGFAQVIALSLAVMVLMVGAVFFPFLEISRMGIGNATSLFGVAMAYSHGWLLPLTLVLFITIIGLPVLRAGLIVYTLWPLSRGERPYDHAVPAFALCEELRPWSMAEIFVIGTTVALVKIAGLANVHPGPAFWAFCVMIVVGFLADRFTSSLTVWEALDTPPEEDAVEQADPRAEVPVMP